MAGVNARAAQGNAPPASVQPRRPRFADVWKHYPRNADGSTMESDDVYKLIGGRGPGRVLQYHIEKPDAYSNACALRLSRAFNYGGLPLPANVHGHHGLGGDDKTYLFQVVEMIDFVLNRFGPADVSKDPQGRDLRADFEGKTGVVAWRISGWDNAKGHVTLWNKTVCGDHCYWTSPEPGVKIDRILYWELK